MKIIEHYQNEVQCYVTSTGLQLRLQNSFFRHHLLNSGRHVTYNFRFFALSQDIQPDKGASISGYLAHCSSSIFKVSNKKNMNETRKQQSFFIHFWKPFVRRTRDQKPVQHSQLTLFILPKNASTLPDRCDFLRICIWVLGRRPVVEGTCRSLHTPLPPKFAG